MDSPFRGFRAIFYKESLHLRRDSMAIMFALLIPLVEMVILGAAIDTNVRQVKTVVYDQSGIMEQTGESHGSQQSRALLDRFRNSDTFKVYKYVHSDKDLTEEMIAGNFHVVEPQTRLPSPANAALAAVILVDLDARHVRRAN